MTSLIGIERGANLLKGLEGVEEGGEEEETRRWRKEKAFDLMDFIPTTCGFVSMIVCVHNAFRSSALVALRPGAGVSVGTRGEGRGRARENEEEKEERETEDLRCSTNMRACRFGGEGGAQVG